MDRVVFKTLQTSIKSNIDALKFPCCLNCVVVGVGVGVVVVCVVVVVWLSGTRVAQ